MKTAMRIFLIGFALCLAAGCSWIPLREERINIENSKRLRVGMTKNEVIAVMGEPLADEEFCKPDVWFYYIHCNWSDGLTTEDECMPLVFAKGRLVGWGNPFYARYRMENKDAVPKIELPPEAAAAAEQAAKK